MSVSAGDARNHCIISRHVESYIITLRPRQNGRHFADDIFKCIFFNESIWIWINISLNYVPKGPIDKMPALVQIMAWRCPGDKPLSEPMMVNLLMHICVTRPQWVIEMVNAAIYIYVTSMGEAGILLSMGSANERHCYNVTSFLIGWTHTQTVY